MSIKLISANIEGHKHLESRVVPFLEREQPDVVTLQEVFVQDVERLKKTLGMTGVFVPMALVSLEAPQEPLTGLWGLLLLSKLPILEIKFEYYYGDPDKVPLFFNSSDPLVIKDPNAMNRALVWARVLDSSGEEYLVATTHFTWSINGDTIPLQRQTFIELQKILDHLPDLVLTGDFNAPRGGEIFTQLSKRFRDNIPAEVTTTIDNDLHKAVHDLHLVVDGCFTASSYQASDVRVVPGISDHQAVVATIKRK